MNQVYYYTYQTSNSGILNGCPHLLSIQSLVRIFSLFSSRCILLYSSCSFKMGWRYLGNIICLCFLSDLRWSSWTHFLAFCQEIRGCVFSFSWATRLSMQDVTKWLGGGDDNQDYNLEKTGIYCMDKMIMYIGKNQWLAPLFTERKTKAKNDNPNYSRSELGPTKSDRKSLTIISAQVVTDHICRTAHLNHAVPITSKIRSTLK